MALCMQVEVEGNTGPGACGPPRTLLHIASTYFEMYACRLLLCIPMACLHTNPTTIAHSVQCTHGLCLQVGWRSIVGRWAHVDSSSVLGESVDIADELCITGCIILPHKAIKQSVHEPGTILM
jgi:hypothetical protein